MAVIVDQYSRHRPDARVAVHMNFGRVIRFTAACDPSDSPPAFLADEGPKTSHVKRNEFHMFQGTVTCMGPSLSVAPEALSVACQ